MKQNIDRLANIYSKANKIVLQNIVVVLAVSAGLLIFCAVLSVHSINARGDTKLSPVSLGGKANLANSSNSTQPLEVQQQSPSSAISSSAAGSSSKPSNTRSTSYTSSYKAPVCTKTILPYKTSYYLATWKGAGEVSTTGGIDGYSETCTADSNGYTPARVPLNPVNKTIYVGDGGGSLTVTSHPQSEPYSDVYSRALPACDEFQRVTNYDAVAKQWCLDHVVAGILHYYGY